MKLVLKNTIGPLPTYEFELVDEERCVGRLQLRHSPSKSSSFPEGFESHIYYEIDPEYRGKGYGKEILKLGLVEARSRGLSEVILTCTEENVASCKIIEFNGGKLLDSKHSLDGKLVRKYRIIL